MIRLLHPSARLLLPVLLVACAGPEREPEEASSEPEAFWPVPESGARPKVLLMGWDGVRPDVLAEVPTPVLDTLATLGTFSPEARTGRPTVSGPGWSSMLIGVWPEKHGVMSNDFSSNRYEDYPDFLTRLERVAPALNTFAAVDWLPLVTQTDGGHGGDSPEETTIFYLASGPSASRGRPAEPPTIVDVPVTALAHLGITLDPAWGLDGRAVGIR